MPKGSKSEKGEKNHNRLGLEKSPYLIQHAENPVDWYPWGEEAFDRAQKENKPIFLSIGYSTCHWCHVMEQESFEDPETAKLMNEVFVSIKVDREERPDIDSTYMACCQEMTGGGGWPLTIIMTPDKRPFFAGTYFPKYSRFGQIGMLDLIPQIREVWVSRYNQVLAVANEIMQAIQQVSPKKEGSELSKSTLDSAYQELSHVFDESNGGFGGAPKFPASQNLTFLLRYWKRTKKEEALAMVEKTLQAMWRGGIYDHVGFGFHRYSTDSEWLLPHFEKMLYDQALLAMAYTETYLATGREEYKRVSQEIFTYVLRDMMAPKGGFYAAEDADSQGEEGKFYLWTQEEIEKVLTEKEAKLIINSFDIEKDGNFKGPVTGKPTGKNILHLETGVSPVVFEFDSAKSDIGKRFEEARRKLLAVRKKRTHLHKDDKILTDWNGLMIAALAKGAQAFDESEYIEAAKKAVDFILGGMCNSEGRLLHRYREGEAAISAYVSDYAFLIWGLIEIYETTFDVKYLKAALDLNEDLMKHFWDEKDGGFYYTPDDGENVLVRRKEIYDGAIPSGNSVAMLNLLRLSRLIANPELEKKAAQIGQTFSEDVLRSPAAYVQLMVAVDFGTGPSYEVVIVGNSQAEDTKAFLRILKKQFIPSKVVLFRPTDQDSPEILRLAKFTREYPSINGKATVYVCLNHVCKNPTQDISEMLELLDETV